MMGYIPAQIAASSMCVALRRLGTAALIVAKLTVLSAPVMILGNVLP
jgi:hypothetical protein